MFGDGTDPLGFPITVTGTKAPIAPPPVTGPTEAATPAGTSVAEAPKKKHIWQDVLGAMGDAMLAQGGSKPMYAPYREQQKIGEAMEGFDTDPVGTIKAVSKLDGALGERMLNNYQENEIRKDAAAYTNMARQRDDDLARQQYDDKTLKVGLSMLRNPNIAQPGAYKKILPHLKKYISDRGGDPDSIGLPDEYDADIVNSLLETTISTAEDARISSQDAYRERMLRIREARLAQQEALANSLIGDRETDNNRPKPLGQFVGEDGYHYIEMSDGTTVKSKVKERAPKGAGRRPSPTAAAPAGKKYDDNKMYTNSAGVTKSGKELNAMAQ